MRGFWTVINQKQNGATGLDSPFSLSYPIPPSPDLRIESCQRQIALGCCCCCCSCVVSCSAEDWERWRRRDAIMCWCTLGCRRLPSPAATEQQQQQQLLLFRSQGYWRLVYVGIRRMLGRDGIVRSGSSVVEVEVVVHLHSSRVHFCCSRWEECRDLGEEEESQW
jgi:hypothetical protein